MDSICLYNHLDIVLGKNSSSQMPAGVASLLEKMSQYEDEIGHLTLELSEIDQSIADYVKSIDEVAHTVSGLGSLFNSSKSQGAFGLIALGTKLGGKLYSAKKKSEAHDSYLRKVTELLEKKKEVAQEKLPHLKNMHDAYLNEIFPRFEKLYSKEFDVTVDIDDIQLESKASIFLNALRLVIRSRFLISNIEYCIAEMEAWKNGKNDSSLDPPSVYRELSKELETWPNKLGCQELGWRGLMDKSMRITQGTLQIPVIGVLTNPCIFRSYVGINIGDANNCPQGLIQLNGRAAAGYNKLVTGNIYYTHCLDVYSNYYNPPKKPISFALSDFIKLMLIPAGFFLALLLLLHIEESTFWRIFLMIPLLCWAGLGIESIEQHFDSYFPYVSRFEKYNREIKKHNKTIKEEEDNAQEFHII